MSLPGYQGSGCVAMYRSTAAAAQASALSGFFTIWLILVHRNHTVLPNPRDPVNAFLALERQGFAVPVSELEIFIQDPTTLAHDGDTLVGAVDSHVERNQVGEPCTAKPDHATVLTHLQATLATMLILSYENRY